MKTTNKLKIILLTVKKYGSSSLINSLCMYLNIFPLQAIYVLRETMDLNYIYFNKAIACYCLTESGNNFLSKCNLIDFDIDKGYSETGKNNFIDTEFYNTLD